MPVRRKVTILLWALGALAAGAVSAASIVAADPGHVSAIGLVSILWCAAMLAGLVHHLRSFDCVEQYRVTHKPLAGPREGAQLPS